MTRRSRRGGAAASLTILALVLTRCASAQPVIAPPWVAEFVVNVLP